MTKKTAPTRTEALLERYLKAPYARVVIPESDGRYSAEILEFPGCYAAGNTAAEALANLEDSARSWILSMLEDGFEIPEPTANQAYSGRIALRLPRSLHRKAAQLAQRDRTSLNQFLVTAIAMRVGAEETVARIKSPTAAASAWPTPSAVP